MTEEEFYSAFHQPAHACWPGPRALCTVALAAEGTKVLGNCRDAQVKGPFSSENLK